LTALVPPLMMLIVYPNVNYKSKNIRQHVSFKILYRSMRSSMRSSCKRTP
jgi:hypothetical protein